MIEYTYDTVYLFFFSNVYNTVIHKVGTIIKNHVCWHNLLFQYFFFTIDIINSSMSAWQCQYLWMVEKKIYNNIFVVLKTKTHS